MIVRLLVLLAVLVAFASTAASAIAPTPGPLTGVPLTGSTGLRLLVANKPPFFLDVDTGRMTPVTGLNVRGTSTLWLQAVGEDAVVWLDRRRPTGKFVPVGEIYAVRHRTSAATRIATGWAVAPAADGLAVWVKSFKDGHHCTLAEVGLDGSRLRRPRPLPCSTELAVAGSVPLLVRRNSVVDPLTGRTLLHGRAGVWAISGDLALTRLRRLEPPELLALRDLRSGERWPLPWPSEIGVTGQGGTDQAVVQPNGNVIALDFGDPAYQDSGTQVTDVWLLDPTARSFQHLPDMPAAVSLKFTSMSWTSDGRLVMLARTAGRDVVAVWRPGEKRIAVRRVRLPARNSGSDAFVVW
jgi:hypothetical protein